MRVRPLPVVAALVLSTSAAGAGVVTPKCQPVAWQSQFPGKVAVCTVEWRTHCDRPGGTCQRGSDVGATDSVYVFDVERNVFYAGVSGENWRAGRTSSTPFAVNKCDITGLQVTFTDENRNGRLSVYANQAQVSGATFSLARRSGTDPSIATETGACAIEPR